MATSFRELPAAVLAFIYLALAVVIFAVGEYTPGLPIQEVRAERDADRAQLVNLNKEVSALQVYERQQRDLMDQIGAMQKELDTLKTIVPDDKEIDEFIKAMSDSARASNVSIRSIEAGAVEPKDYFYEAPFKVAVDGPYFQVVDFFTRLSRLSRIINVADLVFSSPSGHYQGSPAVPQFPLRPGTTVYGTFTATTYFTGGLQGLATGTKPGQKAGTAPVRR